VAVAHTFLLRLLQPEDHTQAIDLMYRLQISVGGLVDRKLYSAICNSNREICCVVARKDEALAGIALVELSRSWIRRRPLLAVRMAIAKYRLRASSVSSAAAPAHQAIPSAVFPPAHSAPVRWADGEPRVLFIGVDPAFRGQGAGKLLYYAIFEEIRKQGNAWLLARIATDNLASIRLHQETGWMLYEDDAAVFAVKELRQSGSPQVS
jgi:ribosomal protein S18 acetylase RimI-like enzyme